MQKVTAPPRQLGSYKSRESEFEKEFFWAEEGRKGQADLLEWRERFKIRELVAPVIPALRTDGLPADYQPLYPVTERFVPGRTIQGAQDSRTRQTGGDMKKRMITVIAALALLMVTAASAATAGDLFPASGRGVLVRQDDGYMITETLRGADSHFIGKVYGTLGELTTGFNTCPDFEFYSSAIRRPSQ